MDDKHLIYKDKPLVRAGDTICYGDMDEKYILMLDIWNYDDSGNPNKVSIQVVESADQTKVVKEGFKNTLEEAFDFGTVWLEMALKGNLS